MGLNEYEVTVDGRHPHKTTMLLSDDDAKRLGVFGQKAAAPEGNKARTPRNKAAAPARAKRSSGARRTGAKGATKPAAAAAEDATDPTASV